MLYDIAFLIFSIFYLPTLIFKGKLHGGFAERFAIYGREKTAALKVSGGAIWIEAVSVGEVALLRPFIPRLKERFPGKPIIISTITRTGNELAARLFSGTATVIYFPLDLSFIARRAVDIIKPAVYLMIETEIWPNVLRSLSSSGVPSLMLNGRISDRSYGKYKMAKYFLSKTARRIERYCMQSKTDAERIIDIGAPAERVLVTGNMKFDLKIAVDKFAVIPPLMAGKGGDGLMFVAGSTHPGEEEMVIRSFNQLRENFPNLRLVIAPRHVERFAIVEKLVSDAGLKPRRYSVLSGGASLSSDEVVVVDVIGCLMDIFKSADIVFMGGSLVPHGGQNIIEPAFFGKSILFGPHMNNFRLPAEQFLRNGAAIDVCNAADLTEKARMLLADEEMRRDMGARAKEIVERNRGAIERNLEEIARYVKN